MAALLGAIKGISRTAILLVIAALIPGIAWATATYAEGILGLGFTAIFFVVLGLEAVLGIGALLGVAAEVQESHSQALDRAIREQSAE
jgi:hypothetical protein